MERRHQTSPPSSTRYHGQRAMQVGKRPAGDAGAGAPNKRTAFEAPEFLDDGEDEDGEDVFLDEVMDGGPEQHDFAAGARAHWFRPRPPPVDSTQDSLGAPMHWQGCAAT